MPSKTAVKPKVVKPKASYQAATRPHLAVEDVGHNMAELQIKVHQLQFRQAKLQAEQAIVNNELKDAELEHARLLRAMDVASKFPVFHQ